MPLIIGLHRSGSNTVEVFVDGSLITTFDPRTVQAGETADRPETYGQRLWAALRGNPALPIRWHQLAPMADAFANLSTHEPLLLHFSGCTTQVGDQPALCLDDGAGRMIPFSIQDLTAALPGRIYGAFCHVRSVD